MGTTAPGGGEGYNVFLGGGSDTGQGLGRQLCGPVPSDAVNAILDHVIGCYVAAREPGRTFLDYTRSLDEDALHSLMPQEAALTS